MNPICFTLANAGQTRRFGTLCAEVLLQCPALQDGIHWNEAPLFLSGALGSGKTCLVHALVENLVDAEKAELSSPSFTLCNNYPTIPPVVHCDVYRTAGYAPEELLDALDNCQTLVCVEWADALPIHTLPRKRLDIELKSCEEERIVCVQAHGRIAQSVLEQLALLFHKYQRV